MLEAILLAALVASLAVSLLRPASCRPVTLALALIGVFVLWDQSRLQPWLYVFAALLAIAGRRGERRRDDAALLTARFVIVGIYFWSGLQKGNYSFVTSTWPEVVAPLIAALPASLGGLVRRAGAAVPAIECSIALALLAPRLRRAGVLAAIATHASILALLIAADENSVVWSWNAAMPLVVVVLFWNAPARAGEVLLGDRSARHLAFVAAFGVLPLLSFFGRWDAYLSAALYSGNTKQAVVIVEPARSTSCRRCGADSTCRPRSRCSSTSIAGPTPSQRAAYPAQRVSRSIGREVCRRYAGAGVTALEVLGPPDWRRGVRRSQLFDCRDPSW